MKKKTQILHLLLYGVLFITITSAGNLLAQAPGHGDVGRAIEVVTRYLDMTEDQKNDFVTILQETRDAINSLRKQQKVFGDELKNLLTSGSNDFTKMGELTSQIHSLGQQIRDLHRQTNDNLLVILNDDQDKKSNRVRRAAVLEPVVNAYQKLGILPPVVRPPSPPEGTGGE